MIKRPKQEESQCTSRGRNDSNDLDLVHCKSKSRCVTDGTTPEQSTSLLVYLRLATGQQCPPPASKIKVRFSGSGARERVIPNPAVWAVSQLLLSWDLGLWPFPAGGSLFCAVRSCAALRGQVGQVVGPMRPFCVSAKIAELDCVAERCPSGLRSTLGKRV